MEQFSEKIKELLIAKVDRKSKQKSHQITFSIYKLFFEESVKDLYDKYMLNQFELAQSGQVPFSWVFSHKMKDSPRYWMKVDYSIESKDDFIAQYNGRFISLGYYTYNQGYSSRKDRISGIRQYLFLKKDSSIYDRQLKLYNEEKNRVKEKYQQDHKKWIQEKKQEKERKERYEKKKKQNKQNSKRISKEIKYACCIDNPILSVDNNQYIFSSPKQLLDIGVVYGIVINKKIVYIGSSLALSQRIEQHERCVKEHTNNFQEKYLYKDMRQNGYDFVIFFKGQKVVNKEQLENIQFGYIAKYHPKYNYLGVKGKFRWQDRREQKDKVSWDDWTRYKEENR